MNLWVLMAASICLNVALAIPGKAFLAIPAGFLFYLAVI